MLNQYIALLLMGFSVQKCHFLTKNRKNRTGMDSMWFFSCKWIQNRQNEYNVNEGINYKSRETKNYFKEQKINSVLPGTRVQAVFLVWINKRLILKKKFKERYMELIELEWPFPLWYLKKKRQRPSQPGTFYFEWLSGFQEKESANLEMVQTVLFLKYFLRALGH